MINKNWYGLLECGSFKIFFVVIFLGGGGGIYYVYNFGVKVDKKNKRKIK